MTDYNDGKWHGWNGGECPVHPDSEIEVRNLKSGKAGEYAYWSEGSCQFACFYDKECWSGVDSDKYNPIIAFRVLKPYREPREFWASQVYTFSDSGSGMRWKECRTTEPGATLFREVLE